MNLTLEDRLMLSVVKLNMNDEELDSTNNRIAQISDWEGFTKNIIAHGSAPLFYKKLALLSNANLIPAQVQQQLQQVYYRTLTRSMLLYNALKVVVALLEKENIKVVVLKGAYLSQALYGDIALRQLSDIDILVAEADGLKSVEALKQAGFTPHDPSVSAFIASQTEIVHYPPMVKSGVSIEVHIRLHRKNKAYALELLFPPSTFIRAKFNVPAHKSTLPYYFKRWGMGVRGVLKKSK